MVSTRTVGAVDSSLCTPQDDLLYPTGSIAEKENTVNSFSAMDPCLYRYDHVVRPLFVAAQSTSCQEVMGSGR
jgi:hypothetical protein